MLYCLIVALGLAKQVPNTQVPFVEGNAYTTDPVLPSLLKRVLPTGVLSDVEADLVRFGEETITSEHLLRAYGLGFIDINPRISLSRARDEQARHATTAGTIRLLGPTRGRAPHIRGLAWTQVHLSSRRPCCHPV